MNVSRINTPYRGSQWRQQFADSMISLCPELNPDAIDEMADVEYATSGDIDPVYAARRFVVASGFGMLDDLGVEDAPSGSNAAPRVSGSDL